MKITPVNPLHFRDFSIFANDKKEEKIDYKTIQLPSYPKEYYLSFQGGKSLELQQTVSQLQKNKVKCPPDIEQMALKEIEKGNPDNKKLVDIHKEKYAELKDCDTLEELRFFYPEFSGVKSIDEDEIPYNKGSLIDKFLKGEIKTQDGELFLNPQKDLTLQLVQMYWGDCLSQTDITKACGYHFGSTMQKLGIPIMSPIYGQYLKLSDEDANKAITEASARNRALNETSLSRKGIPLTAEHKRKISEGLKKYYREHPDINFSQTEETSSYFLRNPYQSKIFSEILYRAWNYRDSNSIKKALSKHLKKTDNEINPEILKNPAQALMLKDFWKKNPWAKERWSELMTKSWTRQKMLDRMGIIHEPKKYFPIMGDKFYNEICPLMQNSDPDFSVFPIKDLRDALSVTLLSDNEGDNEPAKADLLKEVCKTYSDTIFEKNLDKSCYDLASSFFAVCQSVSKNPPERLTLEKQKVINELENIRKNAGLDITRTYWHNRNTENLLKLIDANCKLAQLCSESEIREIRELYTIAGRETSKGIVAVRKGMDMALTNLLDAIYKRK